MNTYEQHLSEQEKKAREQQAAYEQARRAQADALAASTQAVYEDAKVKAGEQAAQSVKETDESFRELYDANAVSELIARREAEEAISNMGLRRSGLNTTQQTAISLSRSRADAMTSRQKQAAIATILQELDALTASYDRESVSQTASIYDKADSDVQAHYTALMEEARDRAQALADADYEAALRKAAYDAEQAAAAAKEAEALQKAQAQAQAQKESDEEDIALYDTPQGEESTSEEKDLQEEAEESDGKKYTHRTTPSLTAIKVDTMLMRKKKGDVAAFRFLTQRVNRGYITQEQKGQLMQELGLETPLLPSDKEVVAKARTIQANSGTASAVEYLHGLYEEYMIDITVLYKGYDAIHWWPTYD